MTELVGDVLPFAIAIAASPFPVIPAILLLLSARPRVLGSAFLSGWMLAIAAATTVFAALAGVADEQRDSPAWLPWVGAAIGVALVLVGIRQWLRRTPDTELPQWMASISGATPLGAARMGVLLSAANPKILLLVVAGGLAIGAAEVPVSGAAAAILSFTLLASVTVALPLLAHALFGDRILQPMGSVRDWLIAHNSTVMAVVIVAIGCYLLIKSLAAM